MFIGAPKNEGASQPKRCKTNAICKVLRGLRHRDKKQLGMEYDIIIIGSGPGGYVAAIRAAQLGKKVALVERAELGGICLNWGCIPTKALLKSAQVYGYVSQAQTYGIDIQGSAAPDMEKIVARSRSVADIMSKGVAFLLNKNGVEILTGTGKLCGRGWVEVSSEDAPRRLHAEHIILATGARPRELAAIPVDGRHIITSKQALLLERIPQSVIVVGSGAIGSEFAYYFSALGSRVTLIESLPEIMPLEDEEVSKYMDRSFRKMKVSVLTGMAVKSVRVSEGRCVVEAEGKKGPQRLEAETVLSAIGVKSNIEDIGLEDLGISVERDRVVVDEYYRTNVAGVYAIGDIVPGPALAHVASAEAICCIEKICGLDPQPVDYGTIPSCIYTSPEVASVGMTEKQAIEAGHETRVGKFPLTASGKATASGERDGFVKLIFDAPTDKILGAHMVGMNVTEMIAEPTLAKKLGVTAEELARTIHPHPTISEAVMEAAEASHKRAIHL